MLGRPPAFFSRPRPAGFFLNPFPPYARSHVMGIDVKGIGSDCPVARTPGFQMRLPMTATLFAYEPTRNPARRTEAERPAAAWQVASSRRSVLSFTGAKSEAYRSGFWSSSSSWTSPEMSSGLGAGPAGAPGLRRNDPFTTKVAESPGGRTRVTSQPTDQGGSQKIFTVSSQFSFTMEPLTVTSPSALSSYLAPLISTPDLPSMETEDPASMETLVPALNSTSPPLASPETLMLASISTLFAASMLTSPPESMPMSSPALMSMPPSDSSVMPPVTFHS